MDATSIGHRLQLSSAQTTVWLDTQLGAALPAWNIAEFVEIHGPIDHASLVAALQRTVAVTTALRLALDPGASLPQQIILPRVDFDVPLVSFGGRGDGERRALAWMHEQRRRPFLPHGPLFRFALLELGENRYYWFGAYSHIAVDGVGVALIAARIARFYTAIVSGGHCDEPCDEQLYREFVAADARYPDSAQYIRDREYWDRVQRGPCETVSLAGVAVGDAGDESIRRTCEWSADFMHVLGGHAAQLQVSITHLVAALITVYLHRLTGVRAVPVGFVARGRGGKFRHLIGMGTKIVPARLIVDPSQRGDEAVRSICAQLKQAISHYRYHGFGHDRSPDSIAQTPLAATVNVMQLDYTLQFGAARAVQSRDLYAGPVADLGFYLNESNLALGGAAELAICANPACHAAAEIDGHLERLRLLVDEWGSRASGPLAQVSLLSERERCGLLHQARGAQVLHAAGHCVHEQFEAAAAAEPDAVAVSLGKSRLTYEQLNARANGLARDLVARGVGEEHVVAICMERSAELIVSLLAVLKAGAAYLPIDPDLPRERVSFILREACVATLLIQEKLRARLADPHRAGAIAVDGRWQQIVARNGDDLKRPVRATSLAYVLYTSGSTGTPKGVSVSHAALANHMDWLQTRIPLRASDRVLQRTAIGFDASLTELLWPLMAGAQIVLLRPGVQRDVEYLLALLEECSISVLQVTPSLLQAMLRRPVERQYPSLRHILCGGEVLPRSLLDRLWESVPAVKVYNLYGPTEAAIEISCHECDRHAKQRSVPIGRPIWNTELYVLDEQLQLVPVGVAGELYIGGAGLARGYLNRPALTAERFVASPFGDGSRLYRTGDRVRYRADGNLEYIGRADHQVKVRGYRIELGEIEVALLKHAQVEQAVVVARAADGQPQQLVGYVVLKEDGSPPAMSELREWLGQSLPQYMVPAVLMSLTQMPLTSNGKLDRKRLPAPDVSEQLEHEYVAPRTMTEEVLAGIWAKVLKRERVGIHDNFFELGGDSILSVTVVALACERHLRLSLQELFRHQTIAELAMRLQSGGLGDGAANAAL